MNYETEQGTFSRSVMAGLFAGIVATLVNLVFDFFYREVTQFNPSQVVNVASIIFASILFSIVAGLLYYFIVPYANKSRLLFVILFIALTVFFTYLAFTVHRSDDAKVSSQFHGLFGGVIIITGVIDALLIPYMARHKNTVF